MTASTRSRIEKYLPFILIIGGLIGLAASFILTIDTFKLLKDPSYSPSCNLNPIISCGSVMKTAQSELLGFPNSLIGVAGFTICATLGLALLAKARFSQKLWLSFLAGFTIATVFVHWLMFESLYRIGSLCPFCMVTWVVTITIFWYVALYNLHLSQFGPKKFAAFIQRHHADILTVWFLVIAGLILNRFWYYWQTLI